MTFDAGNPEAVKERGSKEQRRVKREHADLSAVMDTAEGRRVIWRMLARCRVHEISFAPGQPAETTAFFEGHRNVGNWLFAELQTRHADAYALMAKEHAEDTDA